MEASSPVRKTLMNQLQENNTNRINNENIKYLQEAEQKDSTENI